jgi:hypothetical protein
MLRTTISDYIGALDNQTGVFRTLGGNGSENGGGGEVDCGAGIAFRRDIYGAVEFVAGNSAAIFRYTDPAGRQRFIKCHIRPNPYLREIYDYIARERHPLLPDVRLLPDELFVHTLCGESGRVDIIEGEWTEGETLAAAVARAVRSDDDGRLARLAGAFDELRGEIASAEWAHGDLKPENIIVRGERLQLIDCDAMWIPSLAGRPAVELGTPPWRDPAREATKLFDRSIDLHPARLISQALRTLATIPSARHKYRSLEDVLVV